MSDIDEALELLNSVDHPSELTPAALDVFRQALERQREAESRAPWHDLLLSEWSIVGMNHYHVNGERFLFVALCKDGYCIKEEGRDDKYLWNRLWHKANASPAAPEPDEHE